MAVSVNTEELSEKGRSANPETKFIPAGNRLARLVSYVEFGIHQQRYGGKPATYDTGKNAGKEKPACLHVGLTFEFPTCDFTGDYPLTISTTRRMDNGDFFDAVTIPESLMSSPPTISKSMAMRTKFMKYLTALQNASTHNFASIADFAKAQVPLMITVTNKPGKALEDGTVPMYANMKPEGVNSCRVEDPVTGAITDYSEQVPAPLGEYCTVFDWDAPTVEAWKTLKPWDKKTIKLALNFAGSPIDRLLQANPTIDEIEQGTEDHSTPAEPTKPTVVIPEIVPDDEDVPV